MGKPPRVPTSLVETKEGDDRHLSADSAALIEDGPRRTELTRCATNRASFELDSDDAVRRALVERVRPPRGPFSTRLVCLLLAESEDESFLEGNANSTRMAWPMYRFSSRMHYAASHKMPWCAGDGNTGTDTPCLIGRGRDGRTGLSIS